MGAATTGTSKLADAGLNVVPSIDLMVCLICFLLVATTWTNLSRIPTEQVLRKASQTLPPPKAPEPQLHVLIEGGAVQLKVVDAAPELATPVRVAADGVDLLCAAGSSARCAHADERYARIDKERVVAEMARLARAGGAGARTRVLIGAADDVPYQHLIAVLDATLRVCPEGGDACLHDPAIADASMVR